jgi:hypothetical protein
MTSKIISVSLTPFVEKGKMRFVLTWADAPADLDIYSLFRISEERKCNVFFGHKKCEGVSLDADNFMGGTKGAETITVDFLENYIYSFVISKYVDLSQNGLAPGEERVEEAPVENPIQLDELPPDTQLYESKAKLSIFIPGLEQSLLSIYVPSSNSKENLLHESDKKIGENKEFNWWHVFCLNGAKGLESLKTINKLTLAIPGHDYCEKIYFNEPGFDSIVPRPPKNA